VQLTRVLVGMLLVSRTGHADVPVRDEATAQVQAIRFTKNTGDEQVDSIRRIAGLRRLLPGLHLVVGHDHTDYQWKHLASYLAKGWLSDEERHALSAYESGIFADDGTLRSAAVPAFQPDPLGGAVGTVS